MAGLFSILSLIMFVGFIVGMISPKRAIFWGNEEKKTRSMVLKIYFGLFFVCSIMFGLSAEPSKQSAKATVDTKVEQKEEAKAVVEEEKPAVNPYLQYKDYPTHSVEYTFYYINEYVGSYYNSERAKVEEVIANHPDKASVKMNDNVLSITRQNTGYYYSGEMKNNRPHGIGVYYHKVLIRGEDYYFPIYKGEFKDGKANGYGQTYKYLDYEEENLTDYRIEQKVDLKTAIDRNLVCLEFEGNFKDFTVDGKAIKYEFLGEKSAYINKMEGKEDRDITIWIGDFNGGDIKGKLGYGNGNIKIYMNKAVAYDGKMKNDKFNGYGVVYFPNGNVRYKGEFKNDAYDGKGTLYKEDGSIEYEGKWKNGDYAN